ncbi:MAG TPA: hypothetical protein VJ577_18835 [Burkholderiaceae bacterium]|nr:hypothetical protein [Burkholderiaceae bacterium]
MRQCKHGLVLHWSAFIAFFAAAAAAQAIGLDAIQLQSWLNQPLRATIPLLGANSDEIRSTCVQARLGSSDGVFIGMLQVAIRSGTPSAILLSSRQNINEPAVTVSVDVNCAASIQRSYPLLLDPPSLLLPEVDASQRLAPVNSFVKRAQPETTPAMQINASQDEPLSRSGNRKRQISAVKMHSEETLAAAPAAPRQKVPRAGRPKPGAPARSVLRLSNSDPLDANIEASFKLRLSDHLSDARIESDPGRQNELRAARARLAAALNGHDPLQDADDQIRALQGQMQKLQLETGRLAQAREVDKIALQQIRKETFSFGWIMGLGGLLLLSLGVIIWLMRRVYGMNGIQRGSWWENTATTDLARNSASSALTIAQTTDTSISPATADLQENDRSNPPSDRIAMPAEPPLAVADCETSSVSPVSPVSPADSTVSELPAYSRRSNGLKAEEISGGMEEAEFWILLNVPERAIEILEQFNNSDQPSSPIPWMCLLDLYREVGEEEKYTELLHRFANQFNVNVPEWKDNVAMEKLSSLDNFPYLINRICDLWHTADIIPFLEKLLYDDRNGTRTGFDMPVYRDIMLLTGIAHELAQSGQAAETPHAAST